MPRQPRTTIPGLPHLVTIRAKRPLLFREPADYERYRKLLRRCCASAGIRLSAYVLMPGHVHLIATPETPTSLARGLGDLSRQFARDQRARHGLAPPIFRPRFQSVALDETYFAYALRYVALNPLRANIVRRLWDWPWSSLTALLQGKRDPVVNIRRLAKLLPEPDNLPWQKGLHPHFETLRKAIRTGRPLGSEEFLDEVERKLGRSVRARKRGRKRKVGVEA